MGLRKVLLVGLALTFALVSAAYGAVLLTNDYVVRAGVRPVSSGTAASPRTVARYLEWDVSTAPPGRRPVTDQSYRIATVGLHQNTVDFPRCGTRTLSLAGPPGCPRGSLIGRGFAIIELGPSGENMSSYNAKCRLEEKLFDGGKNKESLYVFPSLRRHHTPAPCRIPGGHAAIKIRVASRGKRLIESFSVPMSLLHPAPGIDATVIREVLHIPARSTTSTRAGPDFGRQVGLFESVFCPPNQQRQVTVRFTREDGVRGAATTLVPCRP